MKIAVLGLGAMGSRLAANILNAGHEVVVYNRSAGRADQVCALGARLAPTPREAAREADVIIAMVRDDEASRFLWLDEQIGALSSLSPPAIAIDCSTLTPAWTKELAATMAARGISFLEAPIVGSRPQAEARQLFYLVGGDEQILTRAKDILQVSGTTLYVGGHGAGAAMKLAVNALFGLQVAALAEILAFLRRAPLDEKKAMEVLAALPVMSPAAKGAASLIVGKNFAPLFPIDLVIKDFSYALAAAREFGLSLPLIASAHQRYEEASRQGFAQDNITGIAQLYG